MNRLKVLLVSKTVWGSVFTTGAWLLSQPKIGLVEVVQAAGAVLTVVGARDAITKANSQSNSQLR